MTASVYYVGSQLVSAVNECVCAEEQSGLCTRWHKLTCIASAGPPPPPPSLEEILARGVVEAPAPTPVPNIVPEVLDTPEKLDAAKMEIVTALEASALLSIPGASLPSPHEIKSEMAFPIAVEDEAAIIADGTPERIEFEISFKAAMSANLGDGDVFGPDDIVVKSITAGSITVDFLVIVPQEVTQVRLYLSMNVYGPIVLVCVCLPTA